MNTKRRSCAFGCLAFVLLGRIAVGQDLHIYHIDVGQGDATLIVSPEGRALLIDAGNTGKGNDTVLPLLNDLAIEKLDYAVATHYDADHIGGLDEVLGVVPAEVVLDHGKPVKESETKAYRDYVAAAGDARREIVLGEKLSFGPSVLVQCVAVRGEVYRRTVEDERELDENGCSVGLLVRHGGFDYFIGGDLTGGGKSGNRKTVDVESAVGSLVGDLDVLKLNHHGSATSSNQSFLGRTRPEVAVVSVGNGGVNLGYHHPSRAVLDRLHELRSLAAVFQTNRGETVGGLTRTDRRLIKIADDNIVISTNGKRYIVNGVTFRVDASHTGDGL